MRHPGCHTAGVRPPAVEPISYPSASSRFVAPAGHLFFGAVLVACYAWWGQSQGWASWRALSTLVLVVALLIAALLLADEVQIDGPVLRVHRLLRPARSIPLTRVLGVTNGPVMTTVHVRDEAPARLAWTRGADLFAHLVEERRLDAIQVGTRLDRVPTAS